MTVVATQSFKTAERNSPVISSATEKGPRPTDLKVSLLTGGFDRPYAFGITMAMAAQGVSLEVIGGAEVDSPEMHSTSGVKFVDMYGDPRTEKGARRRLARVLGFYTGILGYALSSKSKIFHLLWNYKFPLFDRTLLMSYFKIMGKKTVLTVHNVNAGKRDGNDSWLNRLTLKIQYRLADHIFVHTERMRNELLQDFGVRSSAVSVIPFGINNSVPDTDLTPAEARRKLGIGADDKILLFFGAIRQYKGLEYLVDAFLQVAADDPTYRLIIAGEPKKGAEQYMTEIVEKIRNHPSRDQVTQKIEFVPDEQTELYFKAADVSVLPYTLVFQSGVLFLSYSFGLPAIASDVGSFAEDIVGGRTGFVCRACDANDLAAAIRKYFASDLFNNLDARRQEIRDFANSRNSWSVVGDITRNVYMELVSK